MRYVLLDRITELHPPEMARGVKAVSLADDIFTDHFPGHPVYPGAMLIESVAQLGGVLLEASMRAQGREDLHAILVGVDQSRFRRMVQPGDQLLLEARGLRVSEDGGQIEGSVSRDGALVAKMQLLFAFAEVRHPALVQRRKEVLNIWLHGTAHPVTDSSP